MSDRSRPEEPLLDLPEEEAIGGEHIDHQIQKAQEQLFAIKRQQEQLDKQKRELEELSRRQELLQSGKGEMLEKYTRPMVVLERDTYEAQKRVEQLQSIQEGFAQHLDVLESINPK